MSSAHLVLTSSFWLIGKKSLLTFILGEEGLRAYSQVKAIHINLGTKL